MGEGEISFNSPKWLIGPHRTRLVSSSFQQFFGPDSPTAPSPSFRYLDTRNFAISGSWPKHTRCNGICVPYRGYLRFARKLVRKMADDPDVPCRRVKCTRQKIHNGDRKVIFGFLSLFFSPRRESLGFFFFTVFGFAEI